MSRNPVGVYKESALDTSLPEPKAEVRSIRSTTILFWSYTTPENHFLLQGSHLGGTNTSESNYHLGFCLVNKAGD